MDSRNEIQHWQPEAFFRREYEVPIQESFDQKTNHLILVPIRGELQNQGLADFLEMMSQQNITGEKKLGVIFLINDNRQDSNYLRGIYGDEGISKSAIPQNLQTAEMLECLSAKNLTQLEQLQIDGRLKTIGRKLIGEDKIEVRFDYISLIENSPHFGKLRNHLNDLAEKYKSPLLEDEDIVAHLMDVDINLSSHHFQRMMKYYRDPDHKANVSNYDFIPGVFEGDSAYDISREILMTTDLYRLYQSSQSLYRVLTDGYAVGTPAISARLSYLRRDDVQKILTSKEQHEDFALTTKLRDDFTSNLGNESEVYFRDRARYSYAHAMNDAEVRYIFTQNKSGKVPRVLLGVESLLKEAKVEKPRELINILMLRTKWHDKIESDLVRNDNFYHDPSWWFNNIKHIKEFCGDELIAIRDALQKDLPELAELLQTADQNSEIGAFLLYMGVLRRIVTAENDFSLYDKESGFSYNSNQEKKEFSQRVIMDICRDVDNIRGVRLAYQIPEETEEFIEHIYDVMTKIDPEFQGSEQLGTLLQKELYLESVKVGLRDTRLHKVVNAILNGKILEATDQKMTTPFLDNFPEIVETIRQKQADGQTEKEIVKDIETQYRDFFDFTSQTHEQISQLRALRKYVLDREIHL